MPDNYHVETRAIEEALVQMAVLVEDLIARAFDAMAHSDADLASGVIEADRMADDLRDKVRRGVIRIIEHWAPMGPALRRVIAYQIIADELERTGDYAVHVARYAQTSLREMPLPIIGQVGEMAKAIRQQVREGVQALALADEAACRRVCALDSDIDRWYKQLFTAIQDHMRAQPDAVAAGTDLLFAVRDMERIGDRIANICETVIYSITGTHEKLN
jgi:phosphate transport system protein